MILWGYLLLLRVKYTSHPLCRIYAFITTNASCIVYVSLWACQLFLFFDVMNIHEQSLGAWHSQKSETTSVFDIWGITKHFPKKLLVFCSHYAHECSICLQISWYLSVFILAISCKVFVEMNYYSLPKNHIPVIPKFWR